jgi:hypothetical protein
MLQSLKARLRQQNSQWLKPTFRTSRKYYPNLAISALETTRIAAFLASSLTPVAERSRGTPLTPVAERSRGTPPNTRIFG